MKHFFVIFVLAGVLLQSASKLVILVSFQMNKEYIAKNLCVQKNVKRNCCQGTCHLNKELSKEEQKEQAPGNSLKNKHETQLFCQSMAIHGPGSRSFKIITLIRYSEIKPVSYPASIFHPPC